MKSVGEVMSIGRTFCEALQKAARSLETGKDGLVSLLGRVDYRALAEPKQPARPRDGGARARARRTTLPPPTDRARRARALEKLVATPTADRLFYVADAMRVGVHRRASSTSSPRSTPGSSRRSAASSTPRSDVRARRDRARRSCARSSASASATASSRTLTRRDRGRRPRAAPRATASAPVYARVDTCAAEFVAHTPYLYSTYETESEARADRRRRRSSSSAAARTASGRASSSTTAASTPCMALRELGLRDRHGQLQPGDRLDRLRHLRPALLRAAHARGRARDLRRREARWASSCSSAGRRRSSSRCRSRSAACSLLGTTRRRDRPRRGPRPLRRAPHEARAQAAAQRHRAAAPRRRSPIADRHRLSRCSCARATCSAGAR